jgi:hypothetical protein
MDEHKNGRAPRLFMDGGESGNDLSRHTSLDGNSLSRDESTAALAIIHAGVTAARMRRLEFQIASLQKELDEAAAALKRMNVMWVSPRLRRNTMRAARVAWWAASFQLGQKWRAWQRARELRRASPPPLPSAPAPAQASRKALIIENRWPQPDRDGGSIDVTNLIGGLLAFGFEVTFVADQEYDLVSADRDVLTSRGVRCVSSSDASSTEVLLEREGRDIALCVLSRVNGGGRFLKPVIRHCPSAAVVFKAIDLHFVRVEREAKVRGIAADAAIADLRTREELLARPHVGRNNGRLRSRTPDSSGDRAGCVRGRDAPCASRSIVMSSLHYASWHRLYWRLRARAQRRRSRLVFRRNMAAGTPRLAPVRVQHRRFRSSAASYRPIAVSRALSWASSGYRPVV